MANYFHSFNTDLGLCTISWRGNEVVKFSLPEVKTNKLQVVDGKKKVPDWIKKLVSKIQLHLSGKPQDFSKVKLNFDEMTPFIKAVYNETRLIPAGSTKSYKDICKKLGKPNASRAVGTALGKNPILLLMPCHRVLNSSGKLGGFSAPGGIKTKVKLLEFEGVSFEKPKVILNQNDFKKSTLSLLKLDSTFKSIIKKNSELSFKPKLDKEPLLPLISAIVSQQLSTKAAATILSRVLPLISVKGRPSANLILKAKEEVLRSAGLSYMKISFLKDLAGKYLNNEIPDLKMLKKMSNQQIIDSFTKIKGIGQWTVEMYLIFNLGRQDVFPVLDLGIRKAIGINFKHKEMPKPNELDEYSKRWAPYQSVASLYLWHSLNNK